MVGKNIWLEFPANQDMTHSCLLLSTHERLGAAINRIFGNLSEGHSNIATLTLSLPQPARWWRGEGGVNGKIPFLAFHNSSIGDLVTHSLTDSLHSLNESGYFYF